VHNTAKIAAAQPQNVAFTMHHDEYDLLANGDKKSWT
jgi:hypothetical protein